MGKGLQHTPGASCMPLRFMQEVEKGQNNMNALVDILKQLQAGQIKAEYLVKGRKSLEGSSSFARLGSFSKWVMHGESTALLPTERNSRQAGMQLTCTSAMCRAVPQTSHRDIAMLAIPCIYSADSCLQRQYPHP